MSSGHTSCGQAGGSCPQTITQEREKQGRHPHACPMTDLRGKDQENKDVIDALWGHLAKARRELRLPQRLGHPFFQSAMSILQWSSRCRFGGKI